MEVDHRGVTDHFVSINPLSINVIDLDWLDDGVLWSKRVSNDESINITPAGEIGSCLSKLRTIECLATNLEIWAAKEGMGLSSVIKQLQLFVC